MTKWLPLAAFLVGALTVFGWPILTAGAVAPTPTHQANVFFDGVNHGDYRATCRVWQAGRHHQPECVAYLAQLTAMNGPGDYHVLPHSYRGWREGSVEVASVRVFNAASGATLVARLVKTRAHGWLVVSVA